MTFLTLSLLWHQPAQAASDPQSVEFTWVAQLSGTSDVVTYPDVPFRWTVTARATEYYQTSEPFSGRLTASVSGTQTEVQSFLAPGPGSLTLSYDLRGTTLFVLPAGGATVSIKVTADDSTVLFERIANSTITGSTSLNVSAGHRYNMTLKSTSSGRVVGLGNAALDYSGTTVHDHTAEVVASDTGMAAVNAVDTARVVDFDAVPLPAHGGQLSAIAYDVSVDDLRVTTQLLGSDRFSATTTWRTHTVTQWTNAISGQAQISLADGALPIAVVPTAEEARITTSLPTDVIQTWMQDGKLWARLLKLPGALAEAPRFLGIERQPAGLRLRWTSSPDCSYRLLWSPAATERDSWVVIGEVLARTTQTEFTDTSVFSRLEHGFYRLVMVP